MARSVRICVGSTTDRAGEVDALVGRPQRRGRAAPAVHDEAVEGEGERLHAVDVGRQRERRLRLADGQDALGLEIAEGAVVVAAQRPADLGVDVVRERVAGVGERAVALGVERLEALAGEVVGGAADRHEHVAALDADALRRHAHPRVSAAEQLVGHVREVGRRVDPGADVQPLDDDGAVEVGRLGRDAARRCGSGSRPSRPRPGRTCRRRAARPRTRRRWRCPRPCTPPRRSRRHPGRPRGRPRG